MNEWHYLFIVCEQISKHLVDWPWSSAMSRTHDFTNAVGFESAAFPRETALVRTFKGRATNLLLSKKKSKLPVFRATVRLTAPFLSDSCSMRLQ